MAEKKAKLSEADAKVVFELVQALTCELDMHYEDDELFIHSEAMEAVRGGMKVLNRSGVDIPEVCEHLMRRYLSQRN